MSAEKSIYISFELSMEMFNVEKRLDKQKLTEVSHPESTGLAGRVRKSPLLRAAERVEGKEGVSAQGDDELGDGKIDENPVKWSSQLENEMQIHCRSNERL